MKCGKDVKLLHFLPSLRLAVLMRVVFIKKRVFLGTPSDFIFMLKQFDGKKDKDEY